MRQAEIEPTEERFDIKPERLAADTTYGSGANLNCHSNFAARNFGEQRQLHSGCHRKLWAVLVCVRAQPGCELPTLNAALQGSSPPPLGSMSNF
jgi:hypothetical protein